MKILWVKAGKLLPVDAGGKIRSYNLLRQLAARHEVTLLSYYGGRRDEKYEREIAEHLPGAETICTGAPEAAPVRQGLDYLRHVASNAPYAVTKFTAPEVRRRVGAWLNERRCAVAVCDFLSASLNFPRDLVTPTVLFQHNVESALWERQATHEPNPVKRVAFKLEAAKMLAYERATVGRFHHIIAVSEHDREQMMSMTEPARITVVPTGVDLRQYSAAAGSVAATASESTPLVMFLGSMDWEANIDGAVYFCRDIWPGVLAAVPGARFRIVGRNPHPRVRKLASDSVEVTGTVSSVIDHLKEAAVFVVPLRVGGGTRLKIFEAMAMGKAVVSTTIGAEGLDVTHGQDVLLADDARTFADSVLTLLRDTTIRREFAEAAAKLAAQHDWSVVVNRFEDALVEAVKFKGEDATVRTEAVSVSA
ncbi:MAG: glycosyltransferase family 4 protein [Pyrinomonadaceae bacterium]